MYIIVTDIASLVRPKYPGQSAPGPIPSTITPLSHNALCCVGSKQTSVSGFVTFLALLHGKDSEISNLPKELWSFHRCGRNGCVVLSRLLLTETENLRSLDWTSSSDIYQMEHSERAVPTTCQTKALGRRAGFDSRLQKATSLLLSKIITTKPATTAQPHTNGCRY
jgi:hypothetical protein